MLLRLRNSTFIIFLAMPYTRHNKYDHTSVAKFSVDTIIFIYD